MNEANIENQAALAIARELLESKERATHAAGRALDAAIQLTAMLVDAARDARQACAMAAPIDAHDAAILEGIERRAAIILHRFSRGPLQ